MKQPAPVLSLLLYLNIGQLKEPVKNIILLKAGAENLWENVKR